MKIAFVSDAVYPYNKGGKEKRLHEVTTRLAEAGHDVHIYTMKWWSGPKDKVESRVNLHAISKLHPLYAGERRSIKEGVFFGLACSKLLTKKFDVVDVDHMPFFPIYAVWLVCKLRRKKMFASWNEVWGRKYWINYMGWLGNISYVVERLSVNLPDVIISVSPHTTENLKEVLRRKKPIVTIPVGLDLKHINSVKAAKKSYDLMFSGRLLKNKRIDLLVSAMAKMKKQKVNVSCLVVGEGPERKGLEKLAAKLGVSKQITFKDFYEKHDDVIALMKYAKFFVLPSEREGFGIVVIEAMACGTPVITNSAAANAAKDLIVNGQNGFIFDGSAEDLAEIIKNALTEPGKMEASCLKSSKKFDWSKLTDHLAKVYAP